MHFKSLVVITFILHIYIYTYCKATNLYRLFTILFYWSYSNFHGLFEKNCLFIAETCCCIPYIKYVTDPPWCIKTIRKYNRDDKLKDACRKILYKASTGIRDEIIKALAKEIRTLRTKCKNNRNNIKNKTT